MLHIIEFSVTNIYGWFAFAIYLVGLQLLVWFAFALPNFSPFMCLIFGIFQKCQFSTDFYFRIRTILVELKWEILEIFRCGVFRHRMRYYSSNLDKDQKF